MEKYFIIKEESEYYAGMLPYNTITKIIEVDTEEECIKKIKEIKKEGERIEKFKKVGDKIIKIIKGIEIKNL